MRRLGDDRTTRGPASAGIQAAGEIDRKALA